MKKYWIIITNEIQRQLTYRVNAITYRLGQIIELIALVIIWTIIFKKVDVINGYTQKEMITYVVLGWFAYFFTSNYNLEGFVARDIQLGRLSNFITKPISYLKHITVLAIGRVSIATLTAIVIQFFLIAIFYDRIIISASWTNITVIMFMLILGFFLKLFLSIIVGFLAFWTVEVDGLNYSFNILVKFLSGGYMPLGLISAGVASVSLYFPFAYTYFVPIQLYLGKISLVEGLRGLGIEVLWLVFLYGIIKIAWRFGLKKYESVGI